MKYIKNSSICKYWSWYGCKTVFIIKRIFKYKINLSDDFEKIAIELGSFSLYLNERKGLKKLK